VFTLQIKSLELNNFKGIPSSTINLKKINVLYGPNGTGKSSTLEALRCAITGKPPEDAVAAGQSACSVKADILDLGVVERRLGSKSSVLLNGKKTTLKSVAESLEMLLGISSQTSNVLTSSEVLSGMSSSDFSAFLLNEGFMRLDADIDRVISNCTVSAEAEEEMRKYFPEVPEIITTAALEQAHTHYVNARRSLRSELEDLAAKAEYSGIIPAHSTKELAEDRGRVAEKIGGFAAAKKAFEKDKEAYDAHLSDLEEARRKSDSIKETMPLREEIDECNSRRAAIEADIASKERTIAVLIRDVERFDKLIEELGQPVCPISDKLVCTTDKTVVTGEISIGREDASGELVILNAEVSKLKQDLEDSQEEFKRLEDRRDAAFEKEKLLQLIETFEKTMPVKPVEPTVLKLEELTAYLKYLDEEYTLALRYEDSLQTKEELEAKQRRRAVFQEIVEALSPTDGVRKKILEHQRENLERYCNEKAKRILPKYRIQLDAADGMRVRLMDDGGNTIGYGAASKSEKIRIMLILMDMINALSGFRILILDDLESLDKERLRQLVELIQSEDIMDSYDHIFLSGVDHTEFVNAMKALPSADCNLIEQVETVIRPAA